MVRNASGTAVSNTAVAAICAAQVLGMAGFSAVPALLPELMDLWALSHAEGGWLAGAIFAGYVASVLFVVALSDRVDARRVYLVSAGLGVVANLLLASSEGFGQTLLLRALAGVSLAGTYMPGLKALSGSLHGRRRARVVAWYTVSFTIGAGVSFLLAGHAAEAAGWRAAFEIAAAAGVIGLLLAGTLLPRAGIAPAGEGRSHPWRFAPVLRNRAALGFIVAYAAVIWACAGVRQWLVVFLEAASPAGAGAIDVYLVAALASLLGVPAGLLGTELGLRTGMTAAAIGIFLAAALASPLLPLLHGTSMAVVIVGVLAYAFLVQGNVSNLTAGLLGAAEPERLGATMALHSFVGFGGGIIGPACFGAMLDAAGGSGQGGAWVLAYATCGLACLAGALSLAVLTRGRGPPPRGAAG